MHEPDHRGGHAVDGQADEDQGPPPDAVGQRPGKLQRDDVAHGERGQRQAGHRRTVFEGRGGVERDDGHADAEVRPAVGEAGHQRRAVGGVAPGVAEAHDRRGALGHLLAQRLGVEAHGDDQRGHDQREPVDEEWRAHSPRGHHGAEQRPEHVAQQERRAVGRRAFAADVRRRHAHDQAHRRDGEHGRADAAEGAEDQQRPVVPGDADEQGRHGDDGQAAEVGVPVADLVHQAAGRRREDEAEDGKRADHEAGGEDGDVEAAGVLRQDRGDEAEAQRDDERRADQHPDFAGNGGFRLSRSARGGRAATFLLHVSTIVPGPNRTFRALRR